MAIQKMNKTNCIFQEFSIYHFSIELKCTGKLTIDIKQKRENLNPQGNQRKLTTITAIENEKFEGLKKTK